VSTQTQHLEQAARDARQVAQAYVSHAERLEADARRARRAEAFDRVAEVLGSLQENDHACEALLELVGVAVEHLRRGYGHGTRLDRHLDAFALVFTLDRDALASWVADVAGDQYHEEQEEAERERAKVSK